MSERYVPSHRQDDPAADLVATVEEALGERGIAWVRPETGLSPAYRFRVTLASSREVFVKGATTPETEAMLRNEHLALSLAPPHLTPQIVAWIDRAETPVLITECLGHAHWPASHAGVVWRPGDLDRVVRALSDLAMVEAPASLPRAEPALPLWPRILADRERFLALGLCAPAWLQEYGARLAEAEAGLDQSGTAFVHGDVRSDNLCLTDDRVVLVDWSMARAGHPKADLASFLPTACLEGGRQPEDIWPEGSSWAAAQAAELSLRLLTDDAAPPWLRRVLKRLARINLAWAARGLGLPPVPFDR